MVQIFGHRLFAISGLCKMLACTEVRIALITVPPELSMVVMCELPLPKPWTPNLLLRHVGRNNSSYISSGYITNAGITEL